GLHGYAEQRQEPYAGGNTEISARNQKSQQTANGCDGNVRENQQRPFDEDDKDGDGEYDEQPCVGPPLARVFPLPTEGVSGGQFDLFVHLLDRLLYRAAEVTTADTILDGNITPIALAIDFRSAVRHPDLAELRERYSFPRGR